MSFPPRLPADDPPSPRPLSRWFRRCGGWLSVIVLLALLLRLTLVHYGLPLLLYEDEPIYYDHALGFGLGHWHIAYFKKPGFFLYLYGLLYGLGYLYTPFLTYKSYVDAFWENPAYVATLGRTLSVLFAGGSVLLLGKIGQRAFGRSVGLMAALFLAVDATHLRVSPIVISDIPALFCMLAAAWCALNVAEKGRPRDYFACALMIALTISFKYNVFSVAYLLAGHAVFIAQGQAPRTRAYWRALLFSRPLWLSLGSIPLVFLCLNPLVLADFTTFSAHLNLEKRHMLLRNPEARTADFQPMAAFGSIFGRILPRALGWLPYVGGFLGAAWGLRRHPKASLTLLSFPALFLLVVLQFRLINAKYLLPLFPAWYLFAALFYRACWQKCLAVLPHALVPPARQWLPLPLALLLAFWTLNDSARYWVIWRQPDTRALALSSLQKITGPGDTLLLEPDTLTLDNRLFRARLIQARKTGEGFQIRSDAPEALNTLDLNRAAPRYVLVNLGRAEKRHNAQGEVFYTMPGPAAYHRILQTRYQLKAVFSPAPLPLSDEKMAALLQQGGWGELYAGMQKNKFSRNRPGPLLVLLQRR